MTAWSPGTDVEGATGQLTSILQALTSAGIWFGIAWLPFLLVAAIFARVVWPLAGRAWRRVPSAIGTAVD